MWASLTEPMSKPHVPDFAFIAGKRLEGFVPVEVTHWKIQDLRRIRHAKVYGRPISTILSSFCGNVVRHATAIGAEVKIYIPSVTALVRNSFSERTNSVVM